MVQASPGFPGSWLCWPPVLLLGPSYTYHPKTGLVEGVSTALRHQWTGPTCVQWVIGDSLNRL